MNGLSHIIALKNQPIPNMKIFLLFAFLISFVGAQEDFSALLKKGDALDAQLKTKEALAVYLEAEKLQPKNADLLHRIAKQYGESMNDVSSKDDKKAFAEKGLDAAQRAVAADAKNPLAQVALAVSYGRIAPYMDNKTKIAYSKKVKEHADLALAADGNCELAHHVLGAWNYELASFGMVMRGLVKLIYGALPDASYTEAEKHFKKAIALNPSRIANYVELGRTYMEMDREADAIAMLKKGISLPNQFRDDPSVKVRAQAALKDLE
jgi:tetratricopeptide (TPR) repeat protein